jgi:TolA protein
MYRDSRFPFYLRRSFYIHCALVLLTLVGGKIVISEQLKLRNENLKLIRASVRVDMVAMPTQTLEELKAMTPENQATLEPAKVEVKAEVKPEVKEEVKEVAKAALKNDVQEIAKAEADKRQDFLAKLKKLSGKKITKAKPQGPSAEDQQLKKLVLAGNRLSKGTETYGDSNNGEQTAFQTYIARLPQRVKPYWRLPSFLLEKKLKCRVRVWIAMSGQVTRSEIYQSSGDSEYDQKALDAVKSASPFPALSEEFGKHALNGEILLGFPL